MPREQTEVWVSHFSTEPDPKGARRIPTYRNKFEFILSSLSILPCFWLLIVWGLLRRRYRCLYTPYTHYWHIVFILTFKCFGVKTISTVHDGIPHLGDGNGLQKFINQQTLLASDRLIFLTQHVRDFLRERIPFQAPCDIIPHGWLEHQGLNSQLKPKPQKFRLLVLGRICRYKGVDLLLDALHHCDHASLESLTIAGQVQPDQQHLKSFNGPCPIHWVDRWMSETELSEHINRAHILVLPYREATQSGVLTLGVQAGLAMICSRVGGIQEQLSDQECLFVEPQAENIAQALDQIFHEPELYKNLQQATLQKKESLSWTQIAQRVLETEK